MSPRTRPRAPRAPGQAGLTLIELMIAMVILGIAIAAAFSIGFTMINGYRDSRRAVAVERAARGALSFLSQAVRAASAGVETGDITDAVGCSTWKGLEVISNLDAPDELRVVYASGAVVTSLRADVDQDSTELIVTDGSQFAAGDRVLIVTPGVVGHLVAVADSTDNGDGSWTLALEEAPSARCGALAPFSYAATSLVIRAKIAHFYVDDSAGIPLLMMDPDDAGDEEPEPIAEGIEDLQLAVGVDADADGDVEEIGAAANDDEWHFNVLGDTPPPLVTVTPWRAVRITVGARSIVETSTVNDSVRPAAEDRDAATAGDPFRRRNLSTTVEIRNLRGSP